MSDIIPKTSDQLEVSFDEVKRSHSPLPIANSTSSQIGFTANSTRLNKLGLQFANLLVCVILAYTGFLLAYYLRYYPLNFDNVSASAAPITLSEYLGIASLYAAIIWGVRSFKGFYVLSQVKTVGREIMAVGSTILTSTAILTLTMLLVQPEFYYSRMVLVYLVPVSIVLLGLERLAEWNIERILWQRGVGVRNLIVVGATDVGMRLMRNITHNAGLRYRLLGFVDDKLRFSDWTYPARYGKRFGRSSAEVPHLGATNQLNFLIKQHAIDEIIVTLPLEDYQTVNSIAMQCREHNIRFTLVPNLPEVEIGGLGLREINGIPLIVTDRMPLSGLNYSIKRAIDIAVTLGALAVACLPMLIIALAIKLTSPGPIIFRQTRIGKNGQPFNFYKFRSMYVDAAARLAELQQHNETEGATFKMKNDPRVTRIGKFIRRTSLDELPQLFNVLLGQMSLVGPRPGLPVEIARYQAWQHRRLEVMPGITGLWQVNGRSSVSFTEMVKLDIYYVEHWSLLLDIRILLKTIVTVVKGDGAY